MLNPTVPAWFEIPTVDLDRAQSFYERILGVPLRREPMGETELAVFPYGGRPHVSGALIRHEECRPAIQGSVVYLSVDNLEPVLQRVLELGGDTIVPRTEIPGDMGYFAQFRDTEGNRVGLWSAI
ncbi:MAG TPA: VOC family protein [Tahibacter sp.]|uniref:VOC family protein n=1 Tax=Tahibacter sp. TaxID=2056211 RepID=UPI002B739359|nr:VOC family protein [Tahibacter sp.]HSX60870.1 VOC family protein [Tahibacter sp.]